MRLSTHLRRKKTNRFRFAKKARVGYATIYRAAAGQPIKREKVAKKISRATGGEVTVPELLRGFA